MEIQKTFSIIIKDYKLVWNVKKILVWCNMKDLKSIVGYEIMCYYLWKLPSIIGFERSFKWEKDASKFELLIKKPCQKDMKCKSIKH